MFMTWNLHFVLEIMMNCIFTDPLKYYRAFVDIKVADLFGKREGKW
jgi:hypothetical protein